jgi:hypothetical protein
VAGRAGRGGDRIVLSEHDGLAAVRLAAVHDLERGAVSLWSATVCTARVYGQGAAVAGPANDAPNSGAAAALLAVPPQPGYFSR